MFNKQVFRRCLVPVAVAAVAVDVKEKNTPHNVNEEKLCRPSELPLYTPESTSHIHSSDEKDYQPTKLEEAFRATRLKLVQFNKEVDAYKRVGSAQVEKRKDELDWLVNYLRKEDNTIPKVGAIGIGALTGLIFGLRGGFFKRSLYSTTGALTMAAVCYPKEAREYSQVGATETKKYMIVAYNFIHGVKKDDPPLELPSLPKLPTSFTEAWESVKSTATSFVSEEKSDAVIQQQVIDSPHSRTVTIEDPLQIITRARDEAVNNDCHCTIGACMGHYDETSQSCPTPASVPTL